MQNGIFFSIISLCYCILIILIYFFKKRIESEENKVYGVLLITTLIGLLIEVFPSTYAIRVLLTDHYSLSILILKSILVYFIIWISIFTYYIGLISSRKEGKKYKQFLQKEKNILMISSMISIILIYILPLDATNNHGAACTFGMAANYVYLYSAVLIIYWIILLVKNIKNILNKKYYPIFTFIILGVIAMAIQYQYPELTLMISMQTLVVCLMYFTIENPDIQLLRELYKAKEHAENLNNEKSMFLFKVTGRLKDPLKEMNRLSKEALMESDIENIKTNLQEIKSTSNDTLALVNDVLDISELENRKISISNHKYQPINLFKGLANITKGQLKEKPIELRFNYDQSIPEYLVGDSLRIKQILMTLLENAVQHTKEGFIEFNVNPIIKHDVCRLVIVIEDSGKGIGVDQLNHLFDKQKIDNLENRDIDDSQKNLIFIKTLIDLIGGTITVNSEPGRGTKFVVVVDQKVPLEKENKVTEAVKQYQNLYVNKDRVLIITGDQKISKQLSAILKKQHLEYDIVSTGQECLQKIRNKENYNVILMDEDLPKLSSIHTFEKLKTISNYKTPVVLMIQNKDIETKDTYINIGFSDTINKIINKEEIKQILKKYME